jgi:steroid delta-isomerase-like uncharacterized protein
MTPTDSADTRNAALLAQWVESFNAKDVERFLSLHTDDFDYRLPRFGHAARGLAAHRETVAGFIAAVPDRAITVRQTLFQGDAAVVIYAYEGMSSGVMPGLPPAGERVSLEICAVMRFRAGKLAEQVDYS